ncbi:MAG: hypothetical protein ABMA64_27175 [Myxococcota bacterium]
MVPDLRETVRSLVPEVADGTVELVRIARREGYRTQLLVRSADPEVDPVGAIVGPGGARVRALVEHLRGEAIDVIPFHEDPATLLPYAVAPHRVERIVVLDDALIVVVPDDAFDGIVGEGGQRLPLTSQIVGVRLDLFRRSKVDALESAARAWLTERADLPAGVVDRLLRAAVWEPRALVEADRSWLGQLVGDEAADQLLRAAAAATP